MAGKFLERGEIVDLVKSEQATNARRKRQGLTRHPLRAVVCGCPDPTCGGWHVIETERTILTAVEADAALAADKRVRRAFARVRKADAADRTGRKHAAPGTSSEAPGEGQ